MKIKLLGKSGLRVSELCLGTMTFGMNWSYMGAPKDECRKVFNAFVDAGGNFIDTANRYHDGQSEEFTGEFVKGARDKFVIATKYSLSMDADDPNANGNHRKNMIQSVNASLKRLQTDYIDLLWMHAWDYTTPLDEVMRSFDDLVRSGKINYIGISDAPAWIVSMANVVSELRGWSQFIGLQIPYSLIERTVERELLPMAKEMDICVAAWGPLGGGILSGKYNSKDGNEPKRFSPQNPRGTRPVNEKNLKIAEELIKVSNETGKTPSQTALAWLMQQQEKAQVIPILGARTEKHIKDNLGCLDFVLDEKQMEKLNIASNIEMGFPHDFAPKGKSNPIFFGNKVIENHRIK